ncbi:hypothetical protein SBOR_7723 [Sclerotinia borealis F-4128]|uniref:Carboxylesterase family protein n=1 Tax=Sclerotinia borealis (strain F-4128) TaxID=1432307 RepID=W9C7Z1_SCLBF|nr:hypothetical protein SBOR_7723 [Sclerotinia borealis F-4128]
MSRITRSTNINVTEDNTAFIAAQIPLPLTPASNVLAPSNTHILNTTAAHDSEDTNIAQHMKNLKAAYRSALGITKKSKKHNKYRTKGKQELSAEVEHTKGNTQGIENVENIVLPLRSVEATPDTGSVPGINAGPLDGRSAISMSNPEPSILRTDQLRSVQLPTMERAVLPQQLPLGRTTRGQVARQQAGQYDDDVSFARTADTGDPFWKSPQPSGGRSFPFLGSQVPFENGNLNSLRFEYNTNPSHALAMKKYDKIETKDVESPTSKRLQPISKENDRPAGSIVFPFTKQIKTLEEIERACQAQEAATPTRHSSQADFEEDSFIDIIISRSPAKPVSRIEDSLEELDNLEDAIDALDEATLAEKFVASSTKKVNISTEASPDRELKGSPRRGIIEELSATGLRVCVRGSVLLSPQKPKSTYATMRVKPTATKEPILKKAKSMSFENVRPVASPEKQTTISPSKVSRPISLLPPKSPVKSTKPPTKPSFELPGEAIAKRLKEQREARIAQRESSETTVVRNTPGRIKSTKPLTKSFQFELPGEAYSKRKKEAHEAKLKAQEEEDRKRREFKARPMSRSVASRTLPRDTAASRARQSKTGGESSDSGSFAVSKRGSLVGAHRPSILDMQKVNVTASSPRTKASPAPLTRKVSSHHHVPRLAMQRTVSDSDQEMQRQRAKVNRDSMYTAEIEREKREREAAAKRSRDEAAENGRQATREWAERQKAKKNVETMGEKSVESVTSPGPQSPAFL